MPVDSKNTMPNAVNLPGDAQTQDGHTNQSPVDTEAQESNGTNEATSNGENGSNCVAADLVKLTTKSSLMLRKWGEVDIRSPSDKSSSDYWIRASHILPDGGLVVVDSYNDTVKLFDVKHKLTGHVTLPSVPWNVTNVTNKGQVVVTLPGASAGHLQFISVMGKLTVVKTIRTYAGCRGIVHFENKLIVMNDKTTKYVQVHDTLGKLLIQRKASFHWYVAVSSITRTMYISDHYDNSVKCTTMDGEFVAVYKHKDLKHPAGLAVHADGTVYVCGWESNNVHHITAQCRHIETILGNGELHEPQSVCYNHRTNTLYMSEANRHKMKIFKLPARKF